ncbi:hypothetical protein IWQ60_005061 [Tieghemiomyces parasiticus]|uniref:GPI inositol-deacylase n=1 Tax=Tieghemiomyces parasiticus TaxID=78921 RepID=A0A9W8A9T8_9FUNG|nr:hypothetical protein IWQ60_005061 [Tieghemiomyces parasiticus]
MYLNLQGLSALKSLSETVVTSTQYLASHVHWPTGWTRRAMPKHVRRRPPSHPAVHSSNVASRASVLATSLGTAGSSSPRGAESVGTGAEAHHHLRPSGHHGPDPARHPLRPVYKAPRQPVVLCHGLFGFDTLGPASLPYLRIHYWRGITEAMTDIGAQVNVARVPSAGSIAQRADQLDTQLRGWHTGQQVNLIGHSMGGLDGRYLISHIRPTEYQVSSLSTVCTPHRGSPFMDWCRDVFGVGTIASHRRTGAYDPEEEWYRQYHRDEQPLSGADQSADGPHGGSAQDRFEALLSSSYLLTHPVKVWQLMYQRIAALLDTPAYSNLTTEFCNQFFNPSTPNDPDTAYYSYGASYNPRIHTWSSLRLAYEIIKKREGPNDGLVSLHSARWGKYLGTVSADHYDVTNPMKLSELKSWINSSYIVSTLYSQMGSILKYYSTKSPTPASSAQVADMAKYLKQETERPSFAAHTADLAAEAEHQTRKAQEFDAIDFYLRMCTHLHDEGH